MMTSLNGRQLAPNITDTPLRFSQISESGEHAIDYIDEDWYIASGLGELGRDPLDVATTRIPADDKAGFCDI